MTPTRTTCYHHLAVKAAEIMGLENYSNPDDVFKAIIAGQQVDHLAITRKMVNEALDQMSVDHTLITPNVQP